ncbi:tRNA uridine-5-carboxymethylaminomethyl(34) synthesis GTPase MnmE [Desulfovibrionales bacterium]
MTDTIVAIATPTGQGAIGIVRLSGPDCLCIGHSLFHSSRANFADFRPYHLHHGQLRHPDGQFIDEVLAVFMPGPSSFTGEDVLEIHGHGGTSVLSTIVQACIAHGARLALPGEFSKRAVLHGRMDLTQAEAIMELISAQSQVAATLAGSKLTGLLGATLRDLRQQLEALRALLCVALDFPEDEVECLEPAECTVRVQAVCTTLNALLANYERNHCWRDGALVVLAGQVNAGKSSLLNAILGRDRAIVTDIPGTTRDYLEETILIDGLPIRLVDTAGLRETTDKAEYCGVAQSRTLLSQAQVVVLVIDATTSPGPEDRAILNTATPVLIAINKMDLLTEQPDWMHTAPWNTRCVLPISARHGQGIDDLLQAIQQELVSAPPAEGTLVPNLRQYEALTKAHAELAHMLHDLHNHAPYDVLSVRLDLACALLGELTGEISSEDILNKVFAQFCIGK